MRKTDGLENQYCKCDNLHRGNSPYVKGIKSGNLHT